MCASALPFGPGRNPRSSAPTRAAAVCSTLKPCQSAQRAGLGRELPAAASTAAPSGAPAPPAPRSPSASFASRRKPCAVSKRGNAPGSGAEPWVTSDRSGPLGADQADRHCAASQRLRMRAFSTGASARIGADDQDRVGLLDPGDRGVEGVKIPPRRIQRRAVLPAVEIRRAQRAIRSFSASMLSASHRSPAMAPMRSPDAPSASRRWRRTPPARSRLQLAVAPHPGLIEPPALQAVDGESATCRPAIPRSRPRSAAAGCAALRAARVDADVGADRVQHVDAVGLAQFPRPRHERIRL
jgi:hypothetical protein